MVSSNAHGGQNDGLHPQYLRLEDLARILSALGPKPVTVEMLQADIDDGAPVNPDGTMNLLHYSSWLAREVLRGSD